MGPFRWIIAALLVTAFLLLSVANWTLVPFLLPQGRQVMVPLPIIIAIAFLAGWLPTWLSQLATASRLRRRLERTEQLLADKHSPPPSDPS
jgi:uncharacterized integral membrane protein